jgi:MerR family redox-sensitive transcriptional activator SoxR
VPLEAGVPASTIRYWERIGVLHASTRTIGQRRYPPAALQQLAVLRLARSCGFRLDEMRHLLHGFRAGVSPSRRWKELAQRKQQELDERMTQLKAMRKTVDRVMECQCSDFLDCGRLAASVQEETGG